MIVILLILLGIVTFVCVEQYVRLSDANRTIPELLKKRDHWKAERQAAVSTIIQRNESLKTRGRMINELEQEIKDRGRTHHALVMAHQELEKKYRQNANCGKQNRSTKFDVIERAMRKFCREQMLSVELFEVYPCRICLPEHGDPILHFGHRNKKDKARHMTNRLEIPNGIADEIRESGERP